MKKYFSSLFCIMALNACDDGDMVSQSFNFNSEVSASDCGATSTINTVFKINENEALILKIDGPQTFVTNDGQEYTVDLFPFRNQTTQTGAPKIYKISAANRVIYRVFNGPVTSAYFCQEIPPISPSVVSESSTLSNGDGRIEIATSKIVDDYASVAAIAYQHLVTLKDITFTDGTTNTTYETYNYGIYEKKSGVNFSFAPNNPVSNCIENSGRLFRIADSNSGNIDTKENLNEVLEFKISDDELATLDLGDNTNLYLDDTKQLIYRIYSSDVSNTFLCTGVDANLIPTPETYETFVANNGTPIDGSIPATGTISIRRVRNAIPAPPAPQIQTYSYDIMMSNVTFKDQSGNTTFKQGTILFGKYTTDR